MLMLMLILMMIPMLILMMILMPIGADDDNDFFNFNLKRLRFSICAVFCIITYRIGGTLCIIKTLVLPILQSQFR
jgi:hypothetical protein